MEMETGDYISGGKETKKLQKVLMGSVLDLTDVPSLPLILKNEGHIGNIITRTKMKPQLISRAVLFKYRERQKKKYRCVYLDGDRTRPASQPDRI
eukprot:scaffold5539_cov81-Skeletonema_menzelii.AAC.4